MEDQYWMREESIRLESLTQAVASYPSGTPPTNIIISRAQEFAKYIIGEEENSIPVNDSVEDDVNDLIGEIDARVWTKRWLQIISENPSIPTDEGTMIGWFSNVLMAGYDHGRRSEQQRNIVDKLRQIVFEAAGAATRPLLEDHPNYTFPSERVRDAVEHILDEFGIPKEN